MPRRPSVTAEDDLAAAIGADRALVLRQVPVDARPALEALFRVDAAMGDIVARSTQPALGAAKLAWWRERLEDLSAKLPPAEPRLTSARQHLLPIGISGSELATLEDGWVTLLEEQVDPERVAARGAQLFHLAARVLGCADEKLADAGALYALVSVGRRGVPQLIGDAGQPARRLSGYRFAKPLRPVTALARLAARDLRSGAPFEPEGSPPRLAAMLRHRWSGIITRE